MMNLIESLGELVIPDGKFYQYQNLFRVDDSFGAWWDNRPINQNYHILTNGAAEWHQDSGAMSNNSFPAIIVWANIYPTEILLPDGTITAPKDNEVVVLDNKRVKHRSPAALVELLRNGTNPKRNFARRILVTRQPSDADLDSWRKRIMQRQEQINRECLVTS